MKNSNLMPRIYLQYTIIKLNVFHTLCGKNNANLLGIFAYKMFFVSIENIFFYYRYLIIIIPHTYSLKIKNQFDANFTTHLPFIFKYQLQFLVYFYTN